MSGTISVTGYEIVQLGPQPIPGIQIAQIVKSTETVIKYVMWRLPREQIDRYHKITTIVESHDRHERMNLGAFLAMTASLECEDSWPALFWWDPT